MNDDFTQNSGVTEPQGDYSAPQPQADYGAPQYQTDYGTTQPQTEYGTAQSQTDYGTTQSQNAGAQTGNYGQNDAQTGAYQQQTGSYGQNSFAGTNSYSYSNGSAYTNQNPNQSQNLYYGQAGQNKEESIGFGIASLVLGILSVFTFFCCINYIFAILAIIFGIVQMVKSKKKGLAIGGLITAGLSIILSTIIWAVAMTGSKDYLNSPEFNLQQKILEESVMDEAM